MTTLLAMWPVHYLVLAETSSWGSVSTSAAAWDSAQSTALSRQWSQRGGTSISKIVAVWDGGVVLPPCGRCREFMYQIDKSNLVNTEVILAEDRTEKLQELLPHPYDEVWVK